MYTKASLLHGVRSTRKHGSLVESSCHDVTRNHEPREDPPDTHSQNSPFSSHHFSLQNPIRISSTLPPKPNFTMPLRLPTTLRNPLTRAPLRTFTTTRPTLIKEGGNRTPAELEAAKQDQLKEQAEGKGRWREDLASRGESNIKADKEEVQDHGEHIKELQEEGKKAGEGGELGGR
jgi:hypothetical protein